MKMKNYTIYFMKKNIFSFAIMLTFGWHKMQAQDIHFSQFAMTPFHLDPSLAGKFGGDHRGILNHRNQWRSATQTPFVTFGGMFDMHFNKDGKKDHFFGGGISLYSDKAGAGALKTTMVNLSIAYHIKLSQGQYFSGGIQGSMVQRNINPDALRFDNQFDGTGHNAALSNGEILPNQNFIKPSFSGGVSYSFGDNSSINVVSNNGYSGKKICVGAAVHYFNAPGFSFIESGSDKLGMRYVIHTNNSFGIANTKLAIQPSGFIAMQRRATDVVLGSYFRFNLSERSKYTQIVKGAAISFGAHYRLGDALIPGVLMEMGSFSCGLSYDMNLSGLTGATSGRGGYEISLRFISPNPFMPRSQSRFF